MTKEVDVVPDSKGPIRPTWAERMLNAVEWLGNRLPDPAALFLLALVATWLASSFLAPISFSEIDPRTVRPGQTPQPVQIQDQMTGAAIVTFLTKMVRTFIEFPPLCLVLVTMLRLGVAEHTGFVNALIKYVLGCMPARLLTPTLLTVGIVSHSAGDIGHVLLVPLGGVIFYAAGRHPLAGIAAAFAGVSGGFSASFVPVALDAQLAGITQEAARLIDPAASVNPLVNYYFTTVSSLLIIGFGWWITDRVIEPRLKRTTVVDGDMSDMPKFEEPTAAERRGLTAALVTMAVGVALMVITAWPADSAWRSPAGVLVASDAPIIRSIVAL